MTACPFCAVGRRNVGVRASQEQKWRVSCRISGSLHVVDGRRRMGYVELRPPTRLDRHRRRSIARQHRSPELGGGCDRCSGNRCRSILSDLARRLAAQDRKCEPQRRDLGRCVCVV